MNALVSIDTILEPTVPLSAATLFGGGQIEAILTTIEKDVRAEIYDVATEEGRERIKSVAYKIARSKTTLDEIGKEHVAAIKAQTAAIDKERKTLRDRLDALKDEIRKPVTDWEEAEAARIADCEGALVAVIESGRQAAGKTPAMIRELIQIVAGYSAREWHEFKERADAAVAESLHTLNDALAAAEQRERDAAELEALRKEKAERDRKDAERAAAEQAEARRLAAVAAEAERAERAEADKAAAVAAAVRQAEERAEREKAAAIEAERRRQEQAAADEQYRRNMEAIAEKKRQDNKRHRMKVHAAAVASLALACNLDEGTAREIVERVADLAVLHMSINY